MSIKKGLGAVGLIVFGLSISLVLSEVVVRVWNPSFFDSHLREYHPKLGWTSKVDTVLHRIANKDRIVRYETNDLGFRDVNHSTEVGRYTPSKNLIRIKRVVVIGDSFSESAQVNINQTFWKLLAEKLNASSNHYWEIHNFGVGDYGTLQQLMTLESFALGFKPDIVLVQVFPLNDIYNNSLSAANIASNQDAYRPYLDPDDGFRSVTYLSPIANRLRQHSYLFRVLSPFLAKVFGPFGQEQMFTKFDERMAFVKQLAEQQGYTQQGSVRPFTYFFANTFAPPKEQMTWVTEGWQATDIALTKIVTTASTKGAKPMVMVVPHPSIMAPRVHNAKEALPYQIDRHYAEDRITKHLSQYNVPVVGLLKPFEDRPKVVRPYLDGHFNVATHQLVAEILADTMISNFSEFFFQNEQSKSQ